MSTIVTSRCSTAFRHVWRARRDEADRCHLFAPAILLLLSLFKATHVAAQNGGEFSGCPEEGYEGTKILLDKPFDASEAFEFEEELEKFLRPMVYDLQYRIGNTRLKGRIHFHLCLFRSPTGHGPHIKDLVERLRFNDIVFEVWSIFEEHEARRVLLGFVVVPVRYWYLDDDTRVWDEFIKEAKSRINGAFQFAHDLESNDSFDVPFRAKTEILQGYVALALAQKYFINEEYDLVRLNACIAEDKIRKFSEELVLDEEDLVGLQIRGVMDYITDLRRQSVVRLRGAKTAEAIAAEAGRDLAEDVCFGRKKRGTGG